MTRMALLACATAVVTGCASMHDMRPSLPSGEAFKNPMVCAAAGALLAGGVGAVENKNVMAIGAVAGGLLGWWACDQQEKPLPDADGDGVPDKSDACADTPKGTAVSPNGCPVDADTDGDGVPDKADKCAATPAGAKVDANGCMPTADGDADGVPDVNDLCPNTPAGSLVLPNGCEMDSDSDGIPDSRDRCPGTPAGVKAGGDGCAVDSDNDGVSDILDRCPDTKPGAKVDASGCDTGAKPADAPKAEAPSKPMTSNGPAPKAMDMPTTTGASMVLQGVNFESASAKLKPESLKVLDAVAAQLKSSGVKAEVAGFTDASGSPAVNKALSQRRAEMVMSYLAAKGVPSAKLVAKGYGQEQPVADNGTPEGKARNRRVELRVIEGK